jgi:hypothetical protein
VNHYIHQFIASGQARDKNSTYWHEYKKIWSIQVGTNKQRPCQEQRTQSQHQ